MPLVTEVELAKALGRDRMAIRAAVRNGRITQRDDKRFDLDQAILEFQATTHHEKGHNNRSGSPASAKLATPAGQLPEIPQPEIPLGQEVKTTAYAKARAATQISEALLKSLRYEKAAGNLTPTADVETARFTEFRTLRDACFNIPARIAPLLAGESSVEKCEQMLEAELQIVFGAFADGKLAA